MIKGGFKNGELYMYACMYVCMYVCVCVCVYVGVYRGLASIDGYSLVAWRNARDVLVANV